MQSISYESFSQDFESQRMIVTHEFFPSYTEIHIGKYKSREPLHVAIKQGRFLKEECDIHREISKIKHPNIVSFIAEVTSPYNTEDEPQSWILMEAHGLALNDYYKRHRDSLSYLKCIILLNQLSSGLEHIHSLGYIHHDLRDENILIDETAEPVLKICDFGVSEKINEAGHGSETMRKCGYIHVPEQDNPSIPITQKLDIFSFGSIGWGLLLHGRNSEEMFTTAPEILLKILAACQNKNIDERPTAKMLVEWLKTLQLYLKYLQEVR